MTPLQRFFAGDFDGWMQAAALPPPPLWVFVHVPKTAGSSLAADLSEELRPYRSVHIDHLDRGTPWAVRFDRAVDEALDLYRRQPFRFASGHMHHRHVARLVGGVPGARLFTMLREPSARLLSDYLYQRSEMHPLAEEVKARIPDFDAFLRIPGQRNRTAKHLVPKRIIDANDEAAAIAHVEQNFAFAGLQERYLLGFQALTAMLGRMHKPAAQKRVNSAAEDERAEIKARLADPALAAQIAEFHGLDLAIYRHLAARWDGIAASLESWLESQRAAA